MVVSPAYYKIETMTIKFVAAMTLLTLATEVQFIPLQQYVAQPGSGKDPAAASYVLERCAALYMLFSKNLEGEVDPERQKIRAETRAAAERFMNTATLLSMKGSTIKLSDAAAETSKTVIGLTNIYFERIEKARLLANNMFADSLIAGDFAVCKELSHN